MEPDYDKEEERRLDFIDAYNDPSAFPTMRSIAEVFGIHARTVRKWAKKYREQGYNLINRNNDPSYQGELFDDEIVEQNVRLAKGKQKQQDVNRVERKSFREYARVENAIEEYSREICETLRSHAFPEQTHFHNKPSDTIGIVHWSDQHFNELVELSHNRYDWNIAAKRMKKYVDRMRPLCHAYGMSKLLVALTGDIINSDRRFDELLTNAGNRAKASVLAVDLLRQALLDLNQDFDLQVTFVTGNESRIQKDVGWSEEVASDNYDFTIMEMLRVMLESDGIRFLKPMTCNETVVEVNGQNVLIVHGHSFRKNVEVDIQRCKSKYVSRGIQIDMVIFGHIHSAHISDHFARSSSLVGDNSYSSAAGHYESRASQNFYVVHSDGGFDGIKIDLQDVSNVEGYNITERLATYKTKNIAREQSVLLVDRVVI